MDSPLSHSLRRGKSFVRVEPELGDVVELVPLGPPAEPNLASPDPLVLAPAARGGADGTRFCLRQRDGTLDQQWSITSWDLEPSVSRSWRGVFHCGGSEDSTLAAGGWRAKGVPTDLHLWCDTDVNNAREFIVEPVDASSELPNVPAHLANLPMYRLRSAMFPDRFVACAVSDKGATSVELLPIAAATSDVFGWSVFYFNRVSVEGVAPLYPPNAASSPSTDLNFEIAFKPFPGAVAASSPSSPMIVGNNSNSSSGHATRQGSSAFITPTPPPASGATELPPIPASLRPDSMRLDVRYASRADAALVQLFERNCSSAQRFQFRRSATSALFPRAWDGSFVIVPRCAPSKVLTAVPRSGESGACPDIVRSFDPITDADGTLIPSQRWFVMPRTATRRGRTTAGVDVVCAATNASGARLALSIPRAPTIATLQELELTLRPLTPVFEPVIDHCWELHRSMMEELREGSIVRIISRTAQHFGVGISPAQGGCTGGDGDVAPPPASVIAKIDATASESVAAATATCWRVGLVGQALYFTSLAQPNFRLAHSRANMDATSKKGVVLAQPVTANGSDHLWRTFEVQDGWCTLQPAHAPSSSSALSAIPLCLDMPNKELPTAGTPLQLWTPHGGKNQQWRVHALTADELRAIDTRPRIVWVTYHHLTDADLEPLREAGFDVIVCGSTQEAHVLISARRESVACVIASNMARGVESGYISGLELCERVRALFAAARRSLIGAAPQFQQSDAVGSQPSFGSFITPSISGQFQTATSSTAAAAMLNELARPLLVFISSTVAAVDALRVCDLYFSPATGDTVETVVRSVATKLRERQRRMDVASAAAAAALRRGGPQGVSIGSSSLGGLTAEPSADFNLSALGRQTTSTPTTSGFSSRFTIREKIGSGGFGVVFKAFDQFCGDFVAVKELHVDSPAKLLAVEREIRLLTSLQHPNIVGVRCVERSADASCIRIFLEYMSGGSLASVIAAAGHRLHEGVVHRYAQQALQGLCYLHEKGVLHRDIKTGNCLLSGDGVIKIGDFGLSSTSSQAATAGATKTIGTIRYLSPEALHGRFTFASDIWAFACALIAMASGFEPWHHLPYEEELAVMFHIGTAKPPNHHPIIPEHLSESLQTLLRRCLEFDPDQRPTARDLVSHPYMQFGPREDECESIADFQAYLEACEAETAAFEFDDALPSVPSHQSGASTFSTVNFSSSPNDS